MTGKAPHFTRQCQRKHVCMCTCVGVLSICLTWDQLRTLCTWKRYRQGCQWHLQHRYRGPRGQAMPSAAEEIGISSVTMASLVSLSCTRTGWGPWSRGPVVQVGPGAHLHPRPRLQEPHLTALVVLLALLPAPAMLAVVYKFWKKKHVGSE